MSLMQRLTNNESLMREMRHAIDALEKENRKLRRIQTVLVRACEHALETMDECATEETSAMKELRAAIAKTK